MKHFYLLCLFSVMSLAALAQEEYSPMLEDGKAWHYTYSNWATGKTYKHVERIEGDTILNEKTFKKYVNQDGGVLALLREEAGKVYVWNKNTSPHQETLLYDFTLTPGCDVVDYEDEGAVVEEVTTVSVVGESRRHYLIRWWWYDDYTGDRDMEDDETDIWIEGLGSSGGLLTPYPSQLTGNSEHLDYVEFPDGTTFSFRETASIAPAQRPDATDNSIHDLQGRRVQNGKMLPRGVYIQSGRKFVVK